MVLIKLFSCELKREIAGAIGAIAFGFCLWISAWMRGNKQQQAAVGGGKHRWFKIFRGEAQTLGASELKDGDILEGNDLFISAIDCQPENAIGSIRENPERHSPLEKTLHSEESALISTETSHTARPLRPLRPLSSLGYVTESQRLSENLQKGKELLEIELAQHKAQLKQLIEQLSAEIAKRKKAETAAAQSEARFRAMVENSSDLISILEADGTIRFQSPALERILGYPAETMVGQNVFESIHPEDVPAVKSFFTDRLQQPGITGAIEYRVRHAEGDWIYLESVANNLLNEAIIRGIVVNSRDITKRKQAEEQVVFQASLLNQVRKAAIATDLQGNITYWNQFAQHLYQWTAREVTGKNILEVTVPVDNKEIAGEILSTLQTVGYWEGEFTVRRKDGSTFLASVVNALIKDEAGNIKGFVGVSEDISDRKQAQQALQQSEALLRNILDTLPVGVWVTDETGRIVQSNRAGELIWEGVPPIGMDSASQCRAWRADTAQPISEREWAVARAIAAGEITLNEAICIECKGGTRKTILNSAIPLRNSQQEIIGAICINQDITDINRVEAALRDSEQRYRLITENSTDLISKHSLEGVYQYVSPACRRLLGYEPEELLGRGIYEFFHPEDAAAFKQTQQAVGNLPETYRLTYRYRCKDGSYIWFETTFRTVSHPQKQEVQEIIAVSRDISDRKQAEAEICALNADLEQRAIARTAELQRANEELKREIAERKRAEEQIRFQAQILSQVKDAVLAVNNDYRIVYWNVGAEILYNCSADKVLGQPLEKVYQFRWIKGEEESLARKALNSLGSWQGEMIHIKNNGEEIYVDISACVMKDESGAKIGYLAVCRDISDRKRAEQALERLSHQNELILNSAGEGICGLDTSEKITFINPAAARMLGYEVKELIDKPLHTIVYASLQCDTSQEKSICKGLPEGVEPSSREDIFERKDGSSFSVEYVCTPIREQGEMVGATITFKDISDRKAIDRMKQEFISVVSHELRTPLTSMRGALGLISSGLLASQPEKAQRMLEIAVANTHRLVRLIDDILDLDRLESGQIAVNKQLCNVAELMVQSADTMQAMAQKAGVTLVVEPVDAQLWADSDRILQTLTNLLSNAIKFSPPGGTIWLTGTIGDRKAGANDRGELTICVKDQGRGIPADKLETIFERFQQVNLSDSRDKGGTGLGLAICRSLVQQHGGRIWAESQLGEGSRFYFTLPLN